MPDTAAIDSVTAALNYVVDTGVKPVNRTMEAGNMARVRTGTYETRETVIRNGRPLRDTFSLEETGFVFVDHETATGDFFNPEHLASTYYPEVERLIAERTGANRVLIFDHTLRSGSEETREERKVREPVTQVHNDYTEWSGPQRVRDLLPDEAEDLLTRRFAIVQVWRAITPAHRVPPARHRGRAEPGAGEPRRLGAALPGPGGRDLPGFLGPGSPVVLLPPHDPRRGAGVQGLRLGKGRPRPLHRPYRLRGPQHARRRARAREHRNADDRVLLGAVSEPNPGAPPSPGPSRKREGGGRRSRRKSPSPPPRRAPASLFHTLAVSTRSRYPRGRSSIGAVLCLRRGGCGHEKGVPKSPAPPLLDHGEYTPKRVPSQAKNVLSGYFYPQLPELMEFFLPSGIVPEPAVGPPKLPGAFVFCPAVL